MFQRHRYSDKSIAEISTYYYNKDLIEFLNSHTSVLSKMTCSDSIIKIISHTLASACSNGNHYANGYSESELIVFLKKYFKTPFENCFKFSDLEKLLYAVGCPSRAFYFASGMGHIVSNGDQLATVIKYLTGNVWKIDKIITEVEDHWKKAYPQDVINTFLKGSLDRNSSSYTFFQIDGDKSITSKIISMYMDEEIQPQIKNI